MFLRIVRIVVATLCVLVIAQQTNVGSLAFGDDCRDNCPDEGSSHRCPLNCMNCTCVGHGTPVFVSLAPLTAVRPITYRVHADEPKRQLDPRPDTIFHVPRLLLG
jgi:hypothetical protein